MESLITINNQAVLLPIGLMIVIIAGWQFATTRHDASASELARGIVGAVIALIDIALVVAGFFVSYQASDAKSTPPIWPIPIGLTCGILTTAVLLISGSYADPAAKRPGSIRHLVPTLLFAPILASAAAYLSRQMDDVPRMSYIIGWLAGLAAVLLNHCIVLPFAARLPNRLHEPPLDHTIVVISDDSPDIVRWLAGLESVMDIVGYVSARDFANIPLSWLGSPAHLADAIKASAVTTVAVLLNASERDQVLATLARLDSAITIALPAPGNLRFLPGPVKRLDWVDQEFFLFASSPQFHWSKRAFDIVFSTVLLAVLWPLLILIALAIKLDSPGPVLYRQVRVGRNGRQFQMLKFRTMVVDADRRLEALRNFNEASGPLFKLRSDPRITPMGAILRRWALDELPQLFNVLLGDMSLVGPRPALPSEIDQYEDWQLGRLRAVPGLTGLWQVSGRSEVPFHDMVRLDLHYIRTWSPWLDLEIFLRTVPAIVTSRGAY